MLHRRPYRASLLAILTLCGACVALGDDKTGAGGWAPGKADGNFEIRDLGPLADAVAAPVDLPGFVPAYRVESFGGTKLEIDLVGLDGADAYLVVEGPLGQHGDEVAPGRGAVAGHDDDGGEGYD